MNRSQILPEVVEAVDNVGLTQCWNRRHFVGTEFLARLNGAGLTRQNPPILVLAVGAAGNVGRY